MRLDCRINYKKYRKAYKTYKKGANLTMKNGQFWIVLVVVMAGLVIGGFLGDVLGNQPYLSWLSYGKEFGMDFERPFYLDLSLIKLSFAMMFKINIASIMGIVLSLVIYRLFRK